MTTDKIYLVGFMAAGKTTVARALAARLGWRAEDVDELIEARERRPVAEIFARQGEHTSEPSSATSCACCCRFATPSWRPAGERSWTSRTAPPSTSMAYPSGSTCRSRPSLSRIPADGRRPLAADRQQMERLFAARQAAYAQAHLRLDAGAAHAEEIAERILDRIPKG